MTKVSIGRKFRILHLLRQQNYSPNQILRSMKLFELNFAQMLIRYYLMMMVIIVAGFIGQWWLAGLGFFIFLGAIMGAKLGKTKKNEKEAGKVINMATASNEMKKAS